MRIDIICLLLAVGLFAPPSGAQTTPVSLPHSREFTLHSSATQRDYLIQVAIPDQPPPARGYRVLYVLDGNAYWPLLRLAHRQFGHHGPRRRSAPLLIVGIGYPGVERFAYKARANDYTPRRQAPSDSVCRSTQTASSNIDAKRQSSCEAAVAKQPASTKHQSAQAPNKGEDGGAANFLAFIQQQLKPAIATRFNVDANHQAIFGHSFGGLFVSYALLAAPLSFDAYLAISPSLWWDQELVARNLIGKSPNLSGRCLFLGVGGKETPRSPHYALSPYSADTTMADLLTAFSRQLQGIYPELNIKTQIFANERHGSSVWPGSRYALKALRHCWRAHHAN